ncbi:spore cortex-lytic enzyme [Bacillus massiliigorillae]|uniref:spore cortex-lytic enzyme n=1 Tax=Bacillus massiliigorillae TaxID=1243664 RepID=UPI0005A98DC3|nr:spore cortex-lytic enzyme [Bacillus massiliigorillae]
MKYVGISIALLALLVCSFSYTSNNAEAFTEQVIQKGAVGDDVIELQARLQNIGFYHGKIDAVFGWGTYWALRNFQNDFGLPVDGLAGEATKNKLVKASNFNKEFVHEQINKGNTFTYYGNVPIEKQVIPRKQTSTNQNNNNQTAKKNTNKQEATNEKKTNQKAANIPAGFSENDINLLAQAVYGESRGEPYNGQVAVAAVILNRLESPSFPNTISDIIFEPLAFTAVADGQIWLAPNEQAKKAVIDAINGMDPSGNATYYFNPETATSKWIWSRPQIKKIGKHIFCK